MTAHAAVRLVAGFMLTLSLVLAHLVSPYFFLFTAFIGLNLTQFAFTRHCPALWGLLLFLEAEPKEEILRKARAASLGSGVALVAGVALTWTMNEPLIATVIGTIVAMSMAQSAFTGWCPMMVLGREPSRS